MEQLFAPLIQLLESHPIPVNKYRSQSGIGRSQAFGIVKTRNGGYGAAGRGSYTGSRHNYRRPDLFAQLLNIAEKLHLADNCDAITLNQNYQTLPHTDKGNRGMSYIIGFGDYEGGELILDGQKLDIRYKLTPFDGRLLHSTAPFTGQRYSIVFYKIDADFVQRPIYTVHDGLLVEELGEEVMVYDTEGNVLFGSAKNRRSQGHPILRPIPQA